MMHLYHYVAKGNTVERDGILSFARNPNADLSYYIKRSGKTTHAEIVNWFERKFDGRSRGIRAFPSRIQPAEKSKSLQTFIENADLFAIDVNALDEAGLLEAVYVSPSVMDIPNISDSVAADEVLCKLPDVQSIDTTPIDWNVCDDSMGRRFAYVRYYLLIVKDGIIPPRFIKKLSATTLTV